MELLPKCIDYLTDIVLLTVREKLKEREHNGLIVRDRHLVKPLRTQNHLPHVRNEQPRRANVSQRSGSDC
jgi:hypothetical protein